jgi:hypothetical protein
VIIERVFGSVKLKSRSDRKGLTGTACRVDSIPARWPWFSSHVSMRPEGSDVAGVSDAPRPMIRFIVSLIALIPEVPEPSDIIGSSCESCSSAPVQSQCGSFGDVGKTYHEVSGGKYST